MALALPSSGGPGGANLYLTALDTYDNLFYPPFPESFWIQLYVLLGLYSLATLVGVVGLGVRVWRKCCWFLRLERTSRGLRINQNTAVFFLTLKTIFCAFALVSITKHLSVYKHHNGQVNIQIWRTAIWIPLLFGGIAEAVGLTSSSALRKSAQRLLPASPESRSHTTYKQDSIIPYTLLNLVFLFLPLIAVISILVPLLVSNHYYNTTIHDYFDVIRPIVEKGSNEFIATGVLNLAYFLQLLPLETNILAAEEKGKYFVRVSFGIFGSWAVITFFFFVIAARSVLQVLRSQRRILRRSASTLRTLSTQQADEDTILSSSPVIRKSDTHLNTSQARAKEAGIMEAKANELARAEGYMWAQAIVFLICIIGYFILCIALCWDPLEAQTGVKYFCVTELGALWLYAIMGLPAMLLVTYLGFNSESANFIGTPATAPRPKTTILDLSTSYSRNEESEPTELELRQLGVKLAPLPRSYDRDSSTLHNSPSSDEKSGFGSNGTISKYSDEKDTASNGMTTFYSYEEDEERRRTSLLVGQPGGGMGDFTAVGGRGWKPSAWAAMKRNEKGGGIEE